MKTKTKIFAAGGVLLAIVAISVTTLRLMNEEKPKVLAGTPQETSPERTETVTFTRGDFAHLLVTEFEIPIDTKVAFRFEDVAEDSRIFPAVNTLLNRGLIAPNQKFRPNDLLTRAEAVKIFVEFADIDFELADNGKHFTDVPENHFAYYPLETLVAQPRQGGVTPDTYFQPDNPATNHFLNLLFAPYENR